MDFTSPHLSTAFKMSSADKPKTPEYTKILLTDDMHIICKTDGLMIFMGYAFACGIWLNHDGKRVVGFTGDDGIDMFKALCKSLGAELKVFKVLKGGKISYIDDPKYMSIAYDIISKKVGESNKLPDSIWKYDKDMLRCVLCGIYLPQMKSGGKTGYQTHNEDMRVQIEKLIRCAGLVPVVEKMQLLPGLNIYTISHIVNQSSTETHTS